MDENKLFEQEPRSGGFFKTQGFYIMLALCLLIVGTAVALTALPGGEAAPSPTNPTVQSNQSDDETLSGRRTPAPTLRPTVQPSASPAPTAAPTAAPQSTSTGARPARKGSAPAAGSIQWGYAMEQLLYSRTLDQWTTHAGVDIAAAEGTEVCAVLPGTVASVYEDDALGWVVTIAHTNERMSLYGNLDETIPVAEGQKVNEGDVIGTVGDTALAECADEPHLHFGFFVEELPVDPGEHVELAAN